MKKNMLIALLCLLSPVLFLSPAYSADGLYLSANAGVAWLSDSDVTDSEVPGLTIDLSYDAGWKAGAAVGYGVKNFRIEGEVSYQQNDIDETSVFGMDFESTGEAFGWAFLVNGYYDFVNTTAFTPFVSAGLGYANVEIDDYNIIGSGEADFSDDDSVFAYQFGAGIGYAVNENVTIDLKYRFFATSDPEFGTTEVEIQSHDILLGLRYNF